MLAIMKPNSAPRRQQGALILVTLLILLVISVLGMSAIDSTGLEMQMSSNSRAQQQAFEAAEYTLSWVENSIKGSGYFSTNSLSNTSPACGTICFESTCSKGYCFDGSNPNNTANCRLNTPVSEPYESTTIWNNANFHKTMSIPNTTITSKYIIEYRCYTARDSTLPFSAANSARMYRITVYAIAEGGRARVMLRSLVKEV